METKEQKRERKFAAARAERKGIIKSYGKQKKQGRNESGKLESVIAQDAASRQEKREQADAEKDISVILAAKKARKDGASEEDTSRIFKSLSGARKKKKAREIASSIE